jgi:hypothetical protein
MQINDLARQPQASQVWNCEHKTLLVAANQEASAASLRANKLCLFVSTRPEQKYVLRRKF